jgi:signal transduction histidine kinase
MTSPGLLLVVDDAEAERELIANTLSAVFPEASVRQAAHPALALPMCEVEAFDCAILDYNMPDIDGVTLAGQLRTAFPYLPLILMTSFGDEMLAAEALRSGASDYIPKSRITEEAIQRTVDRSIHVSRQARLIDEQRAEIENFAYALAHDFKQPIRQITTFSQLIAAEIGSDAGGAIGQHLTFLCDAASRLAKLVDVMLRYTLLNQPPALADVDLNIVLAALRVSLAPYLAERGAELVASKLPTMIRGNETLLIQVMQNLIMNGLHYNRSKVPRVKVSAQRHPDHWTIEIADNGIGIGAESLAKIFQPLVRLHTASEFAGSGLGLTLARRAAAAQKGVISCESTIGGGSVFRVRLPALKNPARRPGERQPRAGHTARERSAPARPESAAAT